MSLARGEGGESKMKVICECGHPDDVHYQVTHNFKEAMEDKKKLAYPCLVSGCDCMGWRRKSWCVEGEK